MSIDADVPTIFNEPMLWRMEAADALGFSGEDLIAAMSPGPCFPAALRSLRSALSPSTDVIVDVGAGAGGVSEWMRRSTGAKVYAVEPEAGARRTAHRAFPELHVVEGSAEATSLADGIADAVIMSGVVSLMTDIAPAITETDRLLTWAGVFAIADLFSATDTSLSTAPNTFRSIDDLTLTLHRHGFTVAEYGLGEPVPNARWAAVAHDVDDWIEQHCSHRPSYRDWVNDRNHLREHIESGDLVGGCIVARRTASGERRASSWSEP